MQRRQHSTNAAGDRAAVRKRQRVTALWALAACCLQWTPAHSAAAPSSPTNTGPIGASSQPLLPPLSAFIQPQAYSGPASVSLGNTTFRWRSNTTSLYAELLARLATHQEAQQSAYSSA